MIVVDTSVLIRFFTRDDEVKARKAKNLIESSEELVLIDAVVMELVFTLTKVYQQSKLQILEVLKYLLSRPNVRASVELKKAVKRYEINNLSITDCLVIAYGEGNRVASFDKRLLHVEGVRSVWK